MFIASAFLVGSSLLGVGAAASASDIRVNTANHGFLDGLGRTRIFHGMNAVYKVFPWLPEVTGFDPENSLSDIDAKNLKSWGFNVVRLGVMWPGLEPGPRGDYNMTYLDEIDKIVVNLEKENIFVLLDLHQDIWHRKFCGEGVPDYVYDICVAQEPEGTQSFPEPAVHETYPEDENGDPELDSCLSNMFATYYLSAEVGAGFQCLYDNKENLWDAMGGFWATVAARFKDSPNVIGYDLINEPWAGDVYEDPKRLLPGVAESKYLQPLYEHLHMAIRAVDTEKIVFFEGLTIDYWPNAFTEGCPGGVEYNDRQAMSYHVYCPLQDPNAIGQIACNGIDKEYFAMRMRDADRMGSGMMLTEFGAAENIKGDIYALESLMRLADDHQQSWMYWQFKYYEDLTTCTPGTEGSSSEALYFANGTVSQAKLTVLSRTYPIATAGDLVSYHFDTLSSSFRMKYNATSSIAAPTDIYFNHELHYPHGALVSINGEAVVASGSVVSDLTVTCSEDGTPLFASSSAHRAYTNHVLITPTPSAPEHQAVEVTITRCGLSDACTCRR